MKLCRLLQIIFSIILLLGSIGNLSAEMGGRGQGFRSCPDAPYQCQTEATHQEQEVKGKITHVLTETLEEDMQTGLSVLLETKEQDLVHVHLGPAWYLERQHFDLKPGDEVEIKGFICNSKGETRLVANELIEGTNKLSLRDERGRPQWEAWRKH
jgi:hypothetical protein